MASATPWISPVVARIVSLRVVAEVGRRPAGCYVAPVALHGCRQMILWLEGRSTARTMAVIASASGTAVVKPRATKESSSGMTDVTIQGRRNVVGMHANCRRTVVTRSAIVDDVGVIESHRDETLGIMTHTTIQIGRRVWGGGRLSCG